MHGIPRDSDFSFLVGHEVNQICIGSYDLILHAGDLTISIWTLFDHLRHNELLSTAPTIPVRALTTVSLLGCAIKSYEIPDEQTLLLTFSNGECLRLRDDTPMYEAFRSRILEL